jgi:uncharacterized RDD family membrane protein YckC
MIYKAIHFSSFWPRLSAYIIDSIILFLIITLLGKLFVLSTLTMYIVSPFIGWIYYSLFFASSWQATLGYKLNSLKVATLHTKRITFIHASLRYAYSLISALCILLNISFFFTKRRQTFHDLLAKTIVIDNSNPKLYAKKTDKKYLTFNSGFPLSKSIVIVLLISFIISLIPMLHFFNIMAKANGIGLNRFFEKLPTSHSGNFNYSIARETILYNKDKDYSVSSLAECDDGSFVVAGYYEESGKYGVTVWLTKFNKNSQKQWSKTFELIEYGFADILLTVSNNTILIARETNQGSFRKNTTLITKLDLFGHVQWEKTFDGGINHIIKTENGYIYVGSRQGRNNVIVLKIDNEGKLLWQKQYSEEGLSKGNSIIETSDKGYIIVGSTMEKEVTKNLDKKPSKNIFSSMQEVSKQNAWAFKIDQNGSVQWEQVIKKNDYDVELVDLVTNSTDELILVGNLTYGYSNNNNILILKLAQNGDFIWRKIIYEKYYDNVSSITALHNSNFLLAANTTSLSDSEAKGWIIQVNKEGVLIEDATTDSLKASPMGYLKSMTVDNEGNILVAGKLKNNFFNYTKHGSIIYKLKREVLLQ